MPTLKQKRAVALMVENGGVASRAMVDAGYSEETARDPSKLTRSKGFKELMDECGLTDSLVLESLAEDIKAKPKKRVLELRLASDIKGFTKRAEEQNFKPSINIVVFNDGNHDSISIQSDSETIPADCSKESSEVQILDYTQESR